MNDLYEITDQSSNTSLENKINTWVIIGYLVSLFGGLFGIFVATFLINAKKTLPDGQIIYAFNERSRKHGKIILYLGSIILIISILFFLNWLFLTLLFSNKLHFGTLFNLCQQNFPLIL